MVPLKYLSNFWRTLEMPLINCEVNLILTWSSTCVITDSTGAGTFKIDDIELYVPVVILSTQENTKLLQQLKSGFKRVINWNKYLSKYLLGDILSKGLSGKGVIRAGEGTIRVGEGSKRSSLKKF